MKAWDRFEAFILTEKSRFQFVLPLQAGKAFTVSWFNQAYWYLSVIGEGATEIFAMLVALFIIRERNPWSEPLILVKHYSYQGESFKSFLLFHSFCASSVTHQVVRWAACIKLEHCYHRFTRRFCEKVNNETAKMVEWICSTEKFIRFSKQRFTVRFSTSEFQCLNEFSRPLFQQIKERKHWSVLKESEEIYQESLGEWGLTWLMSPAISLSFEAFKFCSSSQTLEVVVKVT